MAGENERLLEIAADTRRVLNDPTGLYANNPDAKAKVELTHAAILARAGVQPKAETPQMVAERQHAASFSFLDPHPNQTELVDQRIAAVEARGNVDRQAAELRQKMGADDYDQLVKEAGMVRSKLGGAVADATVLKLLAARGRYLDAYQHSRPGAKR